MSRLESNLVEAAQLEVMRRVLEPPKNGDVLPDPGVDFDECCNAAMKLVKAELLLQSNADDYFINKARAGLAWCRQIKAPDPVTERIERWLKSLLL